MPLTAFVLHLKVQLYLSQHCTPHSLILPLPDPTLPPEFIWFYSFRFFPARILRWSVLICMHLHNECHLHARGQTIPWERLCCLFVCACVFMHGHMCVLVRVQHILSTSKLQYLTKQKTNNKPLGAVCFFGLFYAGTVQSLCLTRWRRSILASLNCTPPHKTCEGASTLTLPSETPPPLCHPALVEHPDALANIRGERKKRTLPPPSHNPPLLRPLPCQFVLSHVASHTVLPPF